MNLFLIAIIALGLNFCATIYLQVWHDNSTDLSSKKLSKSLNIFVTFLLILLVGFTINQTTGLNFVDMIIATLGFLILRFSSGFYIAFNLFNKLPMNGIDEFNYDSILYLKLKQPEKHGAMLRNIVTVWRWLLLGIVLYIFTGYFY